MQSDRTFVYMTRDHNDVMTVQRTASKFSRDLPESDNPWLLVGELVNGKLVFHPGTLAQEDRRELERMGYTFKF